MTRGGLVAIAMTVLIAVVATASAQVVQSIHGDRVQLAVDLAASAVSAQVFVSESTAISVAVAPFGLIRSLELGSGSTSRYGFVEAGGAGLRAYPFLGDPRRLLAGISAGVYASVGTANEFYDPGNGLPVSRLSVLGGTLAPSVGLSTKLFERLFLEVTVGTGLTVRRVTVAEGSRFPGEIGETAVGIVPVGSMKAGVSF